MTGVKVRPLDGNAVKPWLSETVIVLDPVEFGVNVTDTVENDDVVAGKVGVVVEKLSPLTLSLIVRLSAVLNEPLVVKVSVTGTPTGPVDALDDRV